MPTCFLVLARFFLRVDGEIAHICAAPRWLTSGLFFVVCLGVVFRMLDTRLFHDFSKTFVLRDLTVREEKYDTVYQVLMSVTLYCNTVE